jgi:hypothetical protein
LILVDDEQYFYTNISKRVESKKVLRLLRDIENFKEELRQAEAVLTALSEEARKVGAPPGWFR